jgi:hypothetical protein
MHRYSLALAALAAFALGCSSLQGEGAPPEAREPAADRIFLGDVPHGRREQLGRARGCGEGRQDPARRRREDRAAAPRSQDRGRGPRRRAILPGFIDPHSHLHRARGADHGLGERVATAGRRRREHPALLAALDEHARKIVAKSGAWIVGYGYDKDGLAEGRELTRDDLDSHFPNNPVAVIHQSSHGAVLNSAALRAVGSAPRRRRRRAGRSCASRAARSPRA